MVFILITQGLKIKSNYIDETTRTNQKDNPNNGNEGDRIIKKKIK